MATLMVLCYAPWPGGSTTAANQLCDYLHRPGASLSRLRFAAHHPAFPSVVCSNFGTASTALGPSKDRSRCGVQCGLAEVFSIGVSIIQPIPLRSVPHGTGYAESWISYGHRLPSVKLYGGLAFHLGAHQRTPCIPRLLLDSPSAWNSDRLKRATTSSLPKSWLHLPFCSVCGGWPVVGFPPTPNLPCAALLLSTTNSE
jgi:hypothetical protein